MKKVLLACSIVIISLVHVFAQNNALLFNQSNNYVDCGNILTTTYTKEAWIKLSSNGVPNNIISGSAASQHVLWANGGTVSAGNTGASTVVSDPAGTLPLGVWYHFAVTYNAVSQQMKLYKNGIQVSSAAGVGFTLGTGIVYLGAFDPNQNVFAGEMDEVRIWNTERTAAEILANYNKTLTGFESGLTQYYNFNQTSGTNLPDLATGNGAQNGTLTNLSASPWVASTAPLVTNNALDFDGTNDAVTILDNNNLDFSTQYTFEAWIYLKSYQYSTIVSKFEDDGNNRGWMVNFGETGDNTKLCVTQDNTGAWTNPIQWNSGFTPALNTWYHVAVTFDASLASNEIKLYVNGSLYNQTSWAYSITPSVANVYLGGYDNPGNGVNGGANGRFLNGQLDEVRLWNTARTPAEIQNSYNQSLFGSEPGLVAYYPFNQGVAGATNTGLTTLLGLTTPPNNGILANFALTGATSNWVSGVSYPATTLTGTPNVLSTSSQSTFQVAKGDFNGDGNLDIAAANQVGDNISVFIGNGNGTFATVVNYPAGDGTTGIVTGDFNSDGKLDLISMNAGSPGNITVYTGTGTGTFSGRVDISTGPVRNASVGDINKDGKLDLVIANPNSNNFWLLTGTGTGNFGTPISFTLSAGSYFSTSIADFNKDGNLDVVAINYINNLISVRLGNGVGVFGSETTYATGGNTAIFADVADINQDSNLDILVANQNSSFVSVFTGTGTGTFGSVNNSYLTTPSQGVSAVIAKDINGDGLLDILASNLTGSNISVLTSTGNGAFASYFNINSGGQVWHLVSDDVNNDGKPDIICAMAAANSVSVILNTLSTPPPTFVSISNPLSVCGTNGAITANFTGGFLNYQWYRNGVSIAGANTVTLTSAVSGAYYVVASNIAGSAISSVTTITACNNALQFNGNGTTGPFVTVNSNSNDFNLANTFTLEAWINPVNSGNGFYTIFSKGPSNGAIDNSYIFQVQTGTLQFYNAAATAAPYWYNSGITVPYGTWSHVAVSYTNSILGFYFNGNLVTTFGVAMNLNPGTNEFVIGRQGSTGGCVCHKFHGQIDEARIWNVARTPNDIKENIYRTINGNLPGLVAAYNFDQGIGGGINTGVTTLNDQAGGNHNGTLNTFTLSGSTSNWVGSITTITGLYNFAAPFINLGTAPSICANGTGTFTITASGEGSFSYQWFRNGALLAGQTSATLNLTSALTSAVGTYLVQVSSIYGTSTSAGVVFPNCNNALDFDGVSDDIIVGNISQLNITPNFTAEAWVYNRLNTVVDGDFINTIFSKKVGGNAPGWSLFINSYGSTDGKLVFEGANGTAIFSANSNVVPLNQWTHVAVSLNNGTPNMYINGSLISTTGGALSITTSSTNFRIGNFEGSTFFNNGIIDEARIWNIALTQQDIQNNRFKNLSSTTQGLVGYWDFNQGIPSGTNTGLITLSDRSGNGTNGTLNNFALTGASSNWIAASGGTSVTGVYVYSSPLITGVSPNQTVCSGVTLPLSVTVTGSGLGYQWFKNGISIAGATASTFTLTSALTTSAGVYTVAITSLGGNLTSNGINIGVGCNNALDFDGVDDFLLANHSASLNATNELTVDFWVNRRGNTGVDQSYLDKVVSPSSNVTNYRPLSNNVGNVIFYNGTSASVSSTTYSNNVWTHLAYVINGTDFRVYINGSLSHSSTVGLGATNAGNLYIGRDAFGRNVLGAMDELRIWNRALSAADIAQNYNKKSTGNEPGLMAYYNFDQGISGGNNTGITSILDSSPNGNHATTISGFSFLQGTSTSNFTASGANVSGTFAFVSPSITGITPSQTVCSGVTLPLSVTVSGSGLGYQWFKNGVSIAGATASTVTLTSALTTSAGIYTVAITSLGGNLTSSGINIGIGCNNALNFQKSGSNFVSVPHSTSLNLAANFSIEAWVNYSGNDITIIDKGNYNYTFQIANASDGGRLAMYSINNGGWYKSSSFVPQNTWTHVAVVVGGGLGTFYINGVADGTFSWPNVSQDALPMNIGRQQPSSCQCNHFNGTLDELRIWNVSRTAAEIFDNRFVNMLSSIPGLAAYYKFDQGVASQNNASVTSVLDFSLNGNHGTLQNFTLNGSTSNWVLGNTSVVGVFVYPTPVVTGITSSQTVCSGVTIPLSVTVTGYGLGYQWFKNGVSIAGATASTVTLTSALTTSAGIYTVAITSLGGNLTSTGVSIGVGCNNALNFDGVDDFVRVSNPFTAFAKELTVESWIEFDGGNEVFWASQGTVNADNMSTNVWLVEASLGNNTNFYVNNSGTWINVNVTGITNGWHHVAMVANSSAFRVFVDGIQVGANTGITGSIQSNGAAQMDIGHDIRLNGVRFGRNRYDNFRVWNIALSQADIQANRFKTITNTVPGLVAAYDFNNGIASGSNASATSLIDISSNNRNGVLNNFSLSSGTSNWVASNTTITGSFAFVSPTITGISSSQTVCSGVTLPLSATVLGSGLTYQWLKNGAAISGATSSVLSLTGVTTSSVGIYAVAINSLGGNLTSVGINVSLNASPTITGLSSNYSGCVGNQTFISVAGANILNYQWKKSGSNIPS